MTGTDQVVGRLGTVRQRNVSSGFKAPGLTFIARLYIVGVCLIALAIWLLSPITSTLDTAGAVIFLVLSGLAQLLSIRFNKNASVSLSMAVALAVILLFGPVYAVWVKIPSGLVHYLKLVRPKRHPYYRSAVTTATLVIAVWAAGWLYIALGGQVGSGFDSVSSMLALVVAGFVYYGINTFLISAAMALEARHGFWELLGKNYKWLTLNMASMTPLALGLALIYRQIGWIGLALFMLPIAMAWYSFRLYANSVEDVRKANEELTRANGRLNCMYEISRTLAGSLHVSETFERILVSIRLSGFQNGFVVGPLSRICIDRPTRRATDPSLPQSAFTYAEVETKRALVEFIASIASDPRLASGELTVVAPAEHRVISSAQRVVPTLVLIPQHVNGELWGIVGIESPNALSDIETKELLLFRSMSQSALEVALDHERAELEAMIDLRTGLYNHRYFQVTLQKELQEATQRNSTLSFMMVDINKFKVLNDTYGHQVGDRVLEVIGRLVRENIREGDIGCRYGGDELCVLLPHADRVRSMEIASRIDRAIRNYTFEARRANGAGIGELEHLHVRVSIGIATFPEAANSPAGLIETADCACYRAKALGGGVAAHDEQLASQNRVPHLRRVK
jgi:diguanylate cyclase (GGDEF)-like protein